MSAPSQAQINPFQLMADMPEIPVAQSLAQKKKEHLVKSRLNKISSLSENTVGDTSKTPEELFNDVYGPGVDDQTGFIPAMKSSLYNTAGNLRDVYVDSRNRLADETGLFERDESLNEDSEWNRLSEVEYADKVAGYNRESHSTAMAKLSDQVSLANTQVGEGQILDAVGNYGSAFVTAVGEGDELIGQSIGSMAELTVGTLMVAGTAALLPELGAAAAIIGTIAKLAPKTAKSLAWVAKKVPAASIYGADVTHGYASEYEKATGEKKPLGEIATDFTLASLLGVVQLGTIGRAASNMTMGTFKNTMGHLTKTLDPTSSAFKTLANTVWTKSLQIAETAGAEAGQEFLETWHEIIAGDKKSIKVQLSSKENWDKAVVGAIAGLTTGGTIAAVPAAVTLPASAGMSATKGTVKYGVNKLADWAVGSSYKVLPEEDRQAIADKYEAEDELHKMYSSELDAQTEVLENLAGTKAALDKFLADPKSDIVGELHTAINSIQDDIEKRKADGKPITDTVAKNIITRAIAINRAAVKNSKLQLEASRAKDATYRLYSNIKKSAEATASKILKNETVKKGVVLAKEGVVLAKEAYVITKDFAGDAVETAKNLDSSAARGYMEFVRDGRAGKSLKSLKDSQIAEQLNKVANKIPDVDLDTMIEVAKSDSVVKAALIKVREARKYARTNLGLLSDKIATIDKDSIVAKVKADTKVTRAQAIALYRDLESVASQKIIDPKVKAQFDIALGVLKKSKDITSIQFTVLSNRIKKNYIPGTFNEIKEEVVSMNTDALTDRAVKLKDSVSNVVGFLYAMTKDKYNALKPEVMKIYNEGIASLASHKVELRTVSKDLKEGTELTAATHVAMVKITAAYMISHRGNTTNMKGAKAEYYKKYQDKVDAKVTRMTTVDENVYPMEAPSSAKHKDSTIPDIEDNIDENFTIKKVDMTDEDLLSMFDEQIFC